MCLNIIYILMILDVLVSFHASHVSETVNFYVALFLRNTSRNILEKHFGQTTHLKYFILIPLHLSTASKEEGVIRERFDIFVSLYSLFWVQFGSACRFYYSIKCNIAVWCLNKIQLCYIYLYRTYNC